MAKIKKGDFVAFDFVGRVKSDNHIFDLTVADIAKKEGIFKPDHKYKPITTCVGKQFVIAGLDKALEGKETGKEFDIEVKPEEAFGKRNPKLIQLAPLSAFKEVKPVPGMQLNIDGALTTIRSVSGGRVILDFNHPLSGRTLVYWVRVQKIVSDEKEQAEALMYLFGIKAKISKTKTGVSIVPEGLNKEVKQRLDGQIKELIPSAKVV